MSPRTRTNKNWNAPERMSAMAFGHGEIEARDMVAFQSFEVKFEIPKVVVSADLAAATGP